MGPAFEDVAEIRAASPGEIQVGFRHLSPFLLEALEVQIRKPNAPSMGTGAFIDVSRLG